LNDEGNLFSNASVNQFLNSPYVLQGGELTSWPSVLSGNDEILHWMQEAKRLGKKVEGHLPGASLKTLTKMMLLGVDCDHEALTGDDALKRIKLGYTTSLRYSSIRPDLPVILSELIKLGVKNFDRVLLTTDGSTPAFYKNGVTDIMIRIALEQGIPDVDAYAMASYNIAKHYGLDDLYGLIAPGRIANLNVLTAIDEPTPTAVLAKGEWVNADKNENIQIDWSTHGLSPLNLDWDLSLEDMYFTMPVGIEMVNSVITKPYNVQSETATEVLREDNDESFLMLIDRHGKWHVNTVVKGFARKVAGLASSYSNTGDIILIGKNKHDMLVAFNRMKELGGGIVLTEGREVVSEIKLSLLGGMSSSSMDEVIMAQEELVSKLRERGYSYEDPIYSLLFFSSTHLPFIRITQKGIYDVKKKTVLFPSIMR
jgi:adenine deaminase